MNQNTQRAMDAVLARAATDRSFRERLLTDPRRALKEAFGLVLPDPFTIRFIEREPGLDALVVLPDLRDPVGDGALQAGDLEAVQGGAEAPYTWSD
jgi:hypothetical protein